MFSNKQSVLTSVKPPASNRDHHQRQARRGGGGAHRGGSAHHVQFRPTAKTGYITPKLSEAELRLEKRKVGANFDAYYEASNADDYFMQLRPNDDSRDAPKPLGQGGWDELGLSDQLRRNLRNEGIF